MLHVNPTTNINRKQFYISTSIDWIFPLTSKCLQFEWIIFQVSTVELKDSGSYNPYGSNYPEPYYYSPLDFDPKKHEDKQPLIKYIEDQQKAMKDLMDSIHTNEKSFLDYDKQQKKYLKEYELKQKKYLLEYEKKQKKYLLDNKINKIKTKKEDKIYTPYSYPEPKPVEIIPIPLPPQLPHYEPHYEIPNYKVDYPQKIVVPHKQEESYEQPEDSYPSYLDVHEIVPHHQHSVDLNYPENQYVPLHNPEYTDPFQSWTNEPQYQHVKALYKGRTSDRGSETLDRKVSSTKRPHFNSKGLEKKIVISDYTKR